MVKDFARLAREQIGRPASAVPQAKFLEQGICQKSSSRLLLAQVQGFLRPAGAATGAIEA